ncbi:MAG: metal-dependent transcriptional regulator [Actinomycetota bacterium]
MLATASPAAQDYLKALFMLESAGAGGRRSRRAPVPTNAVAQRLGVSPASATNMLKRLDEAGLVAHSSYKGASLTASGRKIALEVVRHHRLIETYLAEALGVPWDEVHHEAEVLEHVLSEGLEDRIAARLGDPTVDPHGHPIPRRDGSMPPQSHRRLWDAAAGDRVEVDRVDDSHAEALRYLGGLGVRPGTVLEVVGCGPIGGPLFVRVGDAAGAEMALSKEIAEAIWIA